MLKAKDNKKCAVIVKVAPSSCTACKESIWEYFNALKKREQKQLNFIIQAPDMYETQNEVFKLKLKRKIIFKHSVEFINENHYSIPVFQQSKYSPELALIYETDTFIFSYKLLFNGVALGDSLKKKMNDIISY